MSLNISTCLLILLLIPHTSISHPVPIYNHKMTTMAKCKSMYGIHKKIVDDALHPRQQRSEHEGEAEGDLQEEALSPDAVDTMRKINPLTIANQVSQMFRKNGQKTPVAEKLPTNYQNLEMGEASGGDQNVAVASKEEDVHPQPWYVKQETPKIVNKPRSNNDFGYSVIVVAGDPVKIPVKVQGKGVEIRGPKTEDKENGKSVQDEPAAKVNADEEEKNHVHCSRSEIWVPKVYGLTPDFPVYDDDLNFVPDPFQGILEENYWLQPGRVDHQGFEGSQEVFVNDPGFEPHSVQARIGGKGEKSNVFEEQVSCGTWKNNSTDTGVR